RQQRRGHICSEEARIRRAVRTAHPHTDCVSIADTDSPRIAEPETGACLPRKPAIWPSAVHNAAYRTARLENIAHDESCPFAHHAALLERSVGKKSRCPGQSLARERRISADQILERCAGATKNDAQIRLGPFRKFQLQSAPPKHRDKTSRT